MAWQRKRYERTDGMNKGWCDIPEWRVRERFRQSTNNYLRDMEEVVLSGKARVVGEFWYRFTDD